VGRQAAAVAVAAFNEPSLRLCKAGGFQAVREFDGQNGRRLVKLEWDVP
jgi:hypothetical protein